MSIAVPSISRAPKAETTVEFETVEAGAKLVSGLAAKQAESAENLYDAETSIAGQVNRFNKSTLEDRVEKRTKAGEKLERVGEESGIFGQQKELDDLDNSFKRFKEDYDIDLDRLHDLAEALGVGITADTPPQEILDKIYTALTINGRKPDVTQVDIVLAFLIEISTNKANIIEQAEKEEKNPDIKKKN